MRYRDEELRHPQARQKRSSGAGIGVVLILLSLLFIAGPFFVPEITGMSRLILMGFGLALLVVGGAILIITRLYQKAGANEAFVKTGMGGRKAIIDGGAIVVPVVHEVVWVSLETMKLEIARMAKDALLTSDKLRADIRAEFFIRVEKTAEGVLQAATSLGERCSDPREVMTLIEAKLVSALRVVAATMSLEDLNKNRDKFAEEVQKIVQAEIKHNGYMLETVTISHLDQAPPSALDPDGNVFDAEGAKRIAEITSAARVQRTKLTENARVESNQLTTAAEQQIKEQDVKRDQFLFNQDVERTNAQSEADLKKKRISAETAARAAEIEAESQARAATVKAEKDREAQLAQVQAKRTVEVAEVERQQAVQVAAQAQEKEVQTAQVDAQRAVEVAKREQQIAVAAAEKRRAEAEAERLRAEAERTAAEQQKLTVEATATAERQKQTAVIGKEAEARSKQIEQEMTVNVEAYRTERIAEAEQKAAENRAEATRKQAEANRDAKKLEAEGQQAVAMIPVEVERQRVEVHKAEVEVKARELEVQSQHQDIARDLQIELARIAANKEVGVEQARSFGLALSQANLTIWGDPSSVAKIQAAFAQGQVFTATVDGAMSAIPEELRTVLQGGAAGLGTLLAGAVTKLTGQTVSPQIAEKVVRDEAKAAAANQQ